MDGRVVIDGVELDGAAAVRHAITRLFSEVDQAFLRVFDHVDYLFYGRAESRPGVWVAGGISRQGFSLTGSGTTLIQALLAIAGEVAETAMRAFRSAFVGHEGWFGFAAHRARHDAVSHARAEVIERLVLNQWWHGCRPGVLWPQKISDALLSGFGAARTQERRTVILELDDRPGASVVCVASFDRLGRGFAFGAACRQTAQAAAISAGLELAQAEMGLGLARLKRQELGEDRLSAQDRITLTMAEEVDLQGLLASPLTSPPDQRDRPPMPPLTAIEIIDNGVFESLLHVVTARSGLQPLPVALQAAPFAHVSLY